MKDRMGNLLELSADKLIDNISGDEIDNVKSLSMKSFDGKMYTTFNFNSNRQIITLIGQLFSLLGDFEE